MLLFPFVISVIISVVSVFSGDYIYSTIYEYDYEIQIRDWTLKVQNSNLMSGLRGGDYSLLFSSIYVCIKFAVIAHPIRVYMYIYISYMVYIYMIYICMLYMYTCIKYNIKRCFSSYLSRFNYVVCHMVFVGFLSRIASWGWIGWRRGWEASFGSGSLYIPDSAMPSSSAMIRYY